MYAHSSEEFIADYMHNSSIQNFRVYTYICWPLILSMKILNIVGILHIFYSSFHKFIWFSKNKLYTSKYLLNQLFTIHISKRRKDIFFTQLDKNSYTNSTPDSNRKPTFLKAWPAVSHIHVSSSIILDTRDSENVTYYSHFRFIKYMWELR